MPTNFTVNYTVPNDLKMRYLARKKDEILRCLNQIENRDYESVRTLAHQMRGNAANFDFSLLEQLGILLERAATAEDFEQTKFLLEDVMQAIAGLSYRLSQLGSGEK